MVDDIATRHSWPPSSAAGSSGKLEKLASVGRFRSQATLLRPRDGGIVKPLCPPGSTLGQLLSGCPDAPALSIAGGGATFTRSQLAKEVAAVAATLQKHGCVRGSLVAWMLEKTDLSAVVLFLATVSFGGIAAPLSAEWSPAEAEYALQELCPALLILTQDNETPGVLAAKEIAEKVAFVTVHGEGSVQLTSTNKLSQATSFVKRVFPARASFSEAADPALALLVADGTKMSSPSVVLLTHANLLAGAAAAAAAYDLSAGDKTLLAMPLFHANGLCNGLIATLATGGEAVIPSAGRFSAATFWEDVAENGVSWVSAVPAALTLLLRHTHAWEEARRPQLRLFASSCGADLLPTETRNRIERAFNAPVVEAFALPEASMLITCNPTSGERPPGSFGTPCRGMEVAVVSPEGTELPPGEEGAVVMRGPAVCALHMRKGKAVPSPSAASPAGWVPTGRRGWMNAADGSYVIHPDPAFINQGGDRLALSEVDLSFEGFPGVAKVAAFAAVHEVMGQVVAVALEGPALASTKVTNKDLCMWAASASEHPLRARWLPQVTVLLPSERDWPAVEHPSQLAAAFKLPTLSGRASDTFIYTANSGLQRAEGDGKAGKQAKSLGRSVSLLARENKEMAILEAAVLESYAAVLPAMDDSGLGAETNFFDAGGTSLQILALIAEVKQRTGLHVSQSDAFINPTVKQLAGHMFTRKCRQTQEVHGSSGEEDASRYSPVLTPPPVEHAPSDSPERTGWQPAGSGQEQMAVVDAQGFGAAYNMPWCLRLRGPLNVPALKEALLQTVRLEEVLRTLVRLNTSTMRAEQLVLHGAEGDACLEFVEQTATSLQEATAIVENEQNYLFDIQKAPIVRVNLVKINPEDNLLLVNMHHANSDGWSVALHRRQVLQTYVSLATAAANGAPPLQPLPPHSVTFLDFSWWQRKWLEEQGGAEQQLAYWKKELDGAPVLDLPYDRPRPERFTEHGGKVDLHIPAEVVARWRRVLAAKGCTIFMGALALYHVLLSRWTGQEDIVTGAATANRTAHPELATMLGYFANEVAIRSSLAGRPTYSELLERIRAKLLAAWAAQDVPFHEVVAALGAPRVAGTTPVFQAMFALQEVSWHVLDVDTTPAQGLHADIVRLETNRSKFAVHLMLRERADGGLDGDLLYPTDRWDGATMQRMARHYETLAASAVDMPDTCPVGALQMLPPDEQHLVVVEWNKTSPSPKFPPPQRIEVQVAAAAAKYPESIAVEEAGGRKLTYGDLMQQSAAVAAHLGCSQGGVVALAFGRELEMVVGALAVLRSGAAYLAIDVENTPLARIRAMLEDSKPHTFLMIDRYVHLQTELQPLSYSLRFLQWSALDLTAKAVPPPPSVSPDALAGLFYTSGSTGVPKGVETSHANVHNLLHWWIRLVSLSPADKVLQFSSYSFIMSLRQIFPTLCAGATLVLPLASVDFGSAISTCGVTKAALTPSALATIDPQAATSLRVVQVAGEAPTLALAKAWAARLDAFYIGLGPTELTAHACNGRFLPDEGVVTIGHPVSNAAVYITNEEGCVQPAGVVGELWIAGANVAQGYLNQPELTADRFITNPFDSKKPRLYRTGDFARRLSDGRVQFVGRRDAQVKIRGFRVEMREIVDAVLEGCATLQRAEVSLVDDRLVAFIAPDTGLGPDDLDQLRQFCHRRLPAYMVPSQFVPLPAFPLNKNGKLDREALLVSARNAAAGGGAGLRMGAAPSSPMQLQVCRAWAKVLQKSEAEFTCESSFFDMGGTSLSAIMAGRLLGSALGCAVPVSFAFAHQTLGTYATALEGLVGADFVPTSAAAAPGDNLKSDKAMAAELPELQGTVLSRPVFTLLQLLGMLIVLIAGLGPVGGCLALSLWLILGPIGFPALAIIPFVWAAGTATHLILALIAKHLFFGSRLRPGAYRLYSLTFLRWWLQRKLLSITRTWLWYLNQTPFINYAYRLLGASIAPVVCLDDAVIEDPDLVTISEGSYLQPFSTLVPGEILGNALVLRTVAVGAHVKLEPRSAVLGGGAVGDGCVLRPWAAVTATSPAACGAVMEGSPALPSGKIGLDGGALWRPKYATSAWFALGQAIGCYLLIGINVAAFGSSMAIARAIADHAGGFAAGVYCFVAFFLPLFLGVILLTVALKWVLIGRLQPGYRSTSPWFGLRLWVMDRLFMSPILRGATYIWLQEGTLYPLYLRALGVSIGHHAWWNRAFLRTGTELLTIGHSLHAGQMEVFLFAVEDGKGVEFAPIKLGDNCTLGQRVVIMPGVEAGDGVTVGAEGTLYSGVHVAARSTVFGSPPTVFASIADDDAQVAQLQAAVAMEEGKSGKKKETKGKQGTAPAAKVQDQARTPGLVVAAASIANIAAYPAVAALYGGFYVLIVWLPLRHTVARSPAWLALLVPAVYIAGTMVLALLLAVVARCGIANFRAGSTPFYSWRFFAWWLVAWMNDVCSGVLLYPITGTWLYTLFLTLVGAKVGSGAFMAPHGGGFREIDHMEVAEGAVVLTSGVQGHFIDHNALQFAPCRVGVGARLNTGATVMPLSSVGAETTVRAVATTIKGQMLADGGVFVGSPAAAETSGVDVALACKI